MKSIEWCQSDKGLAGGYAVRFIDQTKLPHEEVIVTTEDYKVVAEAIRSLKIRGAPLIGIAAAYGVAIAAVTSKTTDIRLLKIELQHVSEELSSTRPTAVNLFWALNRMGQAVSAALTVEHARKLLIDEATKIHREDAEQCQRIGEHGLSLIPQRASILTHCNTGALATGGEGTALGIITCAHRHGKAISVYASETRPALQGARLTMWELSKAGIDATLITDNMAASLMREKKIDLILVGADRIAINGDTANKIGTYSLAVLAQYHGIPLYVAAPTSTIDFSIESGEQIPLEFREGREVTEVLGKHITVRGAKAYSPAFDVTPSALISAIVTEQGIHRPPFQFSRKELSGHVPILRA